MSTQTTRRGFCWTHSRTQTHRYEQRTNNNNNKNTIRIMKKKKHTRHNRSDYTVTLLKTVWRNHNVDTMKHNETYDDGDSGNNNDDKKNNQPTKEERHLNAVLHWMSRNYTIVFMCFLLFCFVGTQMISGNWFFFCVWSQRNVSVSFAL